MRTMDKPLVRRSDLDWLRVFAILAVFVYHSLHFFSIPPTGRSRTP